MREHELRVDAALQILEDLLDLAADVRQEAVAEVVHLDTRRAGPGQERLGARARLVAALTRRGEDDPVDLELRIRPRERQQRPAATDLDVVRVAADREDATRRLSCRQVQHVPRATLHGDAVEAKVLPRRLARLVHGLQALAILDRVHRRRRSPRTDTRRARARR